MIQSSSMVSHVKKVFENESIIRSENDSRLYRGLQLTNGMKVLLVSDMDADKSAAAMSVNIGSMKDPDNLPGLAHFCEHMLFLGTEKFPETNEYSKFLNEHAGSSNAFTSLECTNYFFDVAPDHLAGALDRFSQFFISPLFTPSATEKEVNAVNSENDRNLQSDGHRIYQLEKSLAKKGHDYAKFSTGNIETLLTKPTSEGIDVRQELLTFHANYYSSNIMGLTILGKESLDELMEMVVSLFCDVRNKDVTVPYWSDPPYGPDQKMKMLKVVPVKDVRNLGMLWSMPYLQPYYKSNPGHYLGHLIGHEGPGSLLSELKSRGWVNTLSAGQKNGAKGFDFFEVTVDLTEDGQEHVEDIVTLTYQYINMLKEEGPQEWVFEECRKLDAMQFRFKDKEKPINYACYLSGCLKDYPMPEVLSAGYLYNEYRPDLINMILELLVPENMRVGVISKQYKGFTDKVEKWYGTEYSVEDIKPDLLERWSKCGLDSGLKIAKRNEFIPSNFDLVQREEVTTFPFIIRSNALSRLWFRQDNHFMKPKACINIDFVSPYAYIDPLHANMNSLFVELFKDSLNEYAYDAAIAGLRYNLANSAYGIELSIKGYNDKLDALLEKILHRLTGFIVDRQRFAILKELYVRTLQNFRAEQPHQHAVYYVSVIMSEVAWTKDELLATVEDLSAEKLQSFIPELLSQLFAECLIYGNVTKQEAIETMMMVEDKLKVHCGTKSLVPSLRARQREVQLPDGCCYVYMTVNEVHKSCSVEMYYQCGQQTTESNSLLELTLQVISDQCFDTLRTQEQLGYIVFSGIRRSKGVQGMRVIVQSSRSPAYVEGRVEAFLHQMEGEIASMTDVDFDKHVAALIVRRLERPKQLTKQNNKYWSEIVSQQYNFDRDNIEVAHLKTISKNDLLLFYKENVSPHASKRRKLCVRVLPQTSTASETTDLEDTLASCMEDRQQTLHLKQPTDLVDIVSFKNSMPLYPCVQPYIDLAAARSKL